MESTFQTLADPSRLTLVELLLERGPTPVNELAEALPIAQSGVSRHLRILRDAGLVKVEAHAQQRLYSIRPEPFQELNRWLSRYRQVWEHRLDALEAAVAAKMNESNSEPGESP